MEFTPYKINETLNYLYYQVPMELFFNPKYNINLSLEAKMLYGLLLSQLTLSLKNNWQDENGDVYVILTRKRAGMLLNLSGKTVTKAFKDLNTYKLIHEKKQGQTKPNLIYVGKIMHDENFPNLIRKKAESVKALPVTESVCRKIYDSGYGKNTTQESEILRPNYINNNYNNRTNKPKSFSNFSQRHYDEGSLDFLYANNNWDDLYDN